MKERKDLFDYFKTQFDNIEDAMKWYDNWKYEWEQEVPNHPEFSGDNIFSLRAMAGQISCFLTGDIYDGSYISTKYGSKIYFGDDDF